MYKILMIVLAIICLLGIISITLLNNKYKKDTSSSKENIIKYFNDNNITSLENGIRTKDLPKEITKILIC